MQRFLKEAYKPKLQTFSASKLTVDIVFIAMPVVWKLHRPPIIVRLAVQQIRSRGLDKVIVALAGIPATARTRTARTRDEARLSGEHRFSPAMDAFSKHATFTVLRIWPRL